MCEEMNLSPGRTTNAKRGPVDNKESHKDLAEEKCSDLNRKNNEADGYRSHENRGVGTSVRYGKAGVSCSKKKPKSL